ncbi:lysophospholipase L1-like esterase [Prauserella sediminis]|uniref:Lysophospholipase L1-like esterase n=1 Tax=Prauserella sediminis TaxID=577680 RepID=A0A839XUM6_9PSEU|nr:lysophospholipase L1-like esterase [Prauserella sediminis]
MTLDSRVQPDPLPHPADPPECSHRPTGRPTVRPADPPAAPSVVPPGAEPLRGAPRRVERLAVLGDSTAVGLGDPLPGGAWRGVGPLLAAALGVQPEHYVNVSVTGARVGCVRTDQLPRVLEQAPDVAVVVAGMNDTLRSDFDTAALAEDLDATVTALQTAGTTVVTVRFHDHGRVFRLPGPLRRAHAVRVAALNSAVDTVVMRREALCVDLDLLPGAYDLRSWSVDRLHPSERGHRLLASGITEALSRADVAVAEPVSLVCSGGATAGTADHVAWLLAKGVPWLWRRGRDLVPYAAGIVARDLVRTGLRAAGTGRVPVVSLLRALPITVEGCSKTNCSR